MSDIDNAKDIKTLSDAVMTWLTSSMTSYQKVGVSVLEGFSGGKVMSSDDCGKNFQLWLGTAAKDMGNVNMVWQQWMKILTPTPPAATTATSTVNKAAKTAKKTTKKAAPAKKSTKKGP